MNFRQITIQLAVTFIISKLNVYNYEKLEMVSILINNSNLYFYNVVVKFIDAQATLNIPGHQRQEEGCRSHYNIHLQFKSKEKICKEAALFHSPHHCSKGIVSC